MLQSQIAPPAIAIAMWMNAFRKGGLSPTDTANACETISGSTKVSLNEEDIYWTDLIPTLMARKQPVISVVPLAGDPSGLPAPALRQIDPTQGAVVFDDEKILGFDNDKSTLVITTTHNAQFPQLPALRIELQQLIATAVQTLSAADLVGSREEIDQKLSEFSPDHVPPTLDRNRYQEFINALKLRIVANTAITESEALHSPSIDLKRIQILRSIDRMCLLVMCAIASE